MELRAGRGDITTAVAAARTTRVQHVQQVRFVLFDDRALPAFEAALSG